MPLKDCLVRNEFLAFRVLVTQAAYYWCGKHNIPMEEKRMMRNF